LPRRILLLVTDLEVGGTPTVVRELAVRLHSPPAVEVEVACLAGRGPVAGQIEAAGIPVTAIGARGARDLPAAVRRGRELVRGRGIDTVFSFLVHANVVAALASRKLRGVRFLQSIQTVQARPRWHWWVQRGVQRYAEKIVVPSSAVARVARERCGVPDEKIVVIPNAIDPDEFPRVPVFHRKPIRVGFLGRLDPVKNLHLFVRCLAWIKGRGDVEGHVFGEGPMRPRLEREIVKRGMAGRIFLRGAVGRPQEALREMDVLLFPSAAEGFGLVVIEAMAGGVPVVALARGGVTDVVRHGVNAVAVDPKCTYHELARGLERVLGDAALRERIIAGGLATVRERFRWEVVLPQYRELLGVS
jgi:glycosyltransferase involved in cell wall biosynthesis